MKPTTSRSTSSDDWLSATPGWSRKYRVMARRSAADARSDLSAGKPFDYLSELIFSGVLEVQAKVSQPLMLARLRHLLLGGGETVLQRADDAVGPAEVRSYPGRTPAELLLVETHHL